MKTRTFFVLLIALLSCTLLSAQKPVERQTQRVKNRAQYKVDREVDRKVDQAMDEVIGSIFGKKKKKKEQAPNVEEAEAVPAEAQEDAEAYDEAEAERRAQARTAAMMGGGSTEDWEPIKNDFPISFDMEVTGDGKNDNANIRYTFDTWLLGMEFQSEDSDDKMLLIMDNEKGTMTTVSGEPGKRQGYRMGRGMMNMGAVADDMEDEDITFTPTGNTKMIDGYFCREYLVKTEDATTNAWLTKEIQANFIELFTSLSVPGKSRNGAKDNALYKYREYGMMLEGTTVTEGKKGSSTTTIKIRNVKLGDQIDRSILDISDVNVMGIGN
jgi:hypothetical protein